MEKPRVGIIGAGQIANFLHLPIYRQLGGAEIVAACDVNEQQLDRVCREYNIPFRYTNYKDLLKRDDIDAVDVCLHNNLHAPVTVDALRAGKHVYCEKPIAGSYADGKLMCDTAKECGKMLHIQLSELYSRETKAAKRLIDQGATGRIYHMRSTGYRRRNRPYVDGYGTASFVKKDICAGGALYDMGVYHISRMLYLGGMPEVDRISGKVYNELDPDNPRKLESGFDVEEFAVGLVKFKDASTLDIIEAWAVNMGEFEGCSIFGTKGGIRLDPFMFYSTYCDMEMDSTFRLEDADTRWHRIDENEQMMDSSMHHWIAALKGKIRLLPTAEIALQTMLIQEGIYMSDTLGREVSAEEVAANSRSTAAF